MNVEPKCLSPPTLLLPKRQEGKKNINIAPVIVL